MFNLLKRKNEEVEADDHNKRVALDSEQLELEQKQQDLVITAPKIDAPAGTETAAADDAAAAPPAPAADLPESVQHRLDGLFPNSAKPASVPEQPAAEYRPDYIPSVSTSEHPSRPVLGRDPEDPNQVSVRMFCPVKEASIIVGKKGDKIAHIREKANVRVYVSENLKGVPDRVVTVKGTAENVARAFGLITRTILEEPEDEPASLLSKQYVLKLLVPHSLVGYVIGKGGSKFREIEESLAAKLKAQEQTLPLSTDRILSVTGVGDAIHIAVYYICQVLLEHQDAAKKHKIILYNPANFQHQAPNTMMGMVPQQSMPYMSAPPHQMHGLPRNDMHGGPYVQKPYDFQMMFQPAARPQYSQPVPATAPPQTLYKDEHGNTIVGDVITTAPVQVGTAPDKFTQDVFVANINIGSVIGKGGNNIKQIRESSGCLYVKIEPDQNQLILLGGGRGLTSIRKLTLTGNYSAIQLAIFLINQRISADKERNGIQ